MVERLENMYLSKHIIHRLLLNDLNLVHVLHSIHLLGILFLDNANLKDGN